MANGVSTSSTSLVAFNQFDDDRGSLRVIDDRQLPPVAGGKPFKIRRVFWIYDVPPGEIRGRHSHRDCEQVLFCLIGRFFISLDGQPFAMSPLSPPVYAQAGVHIELYGFTEEAVCLVLASEYYSKEDVVE